MTGLAKIGSKMTKVVMRCKPIAKLTAKMSKNKPEILAVSGGVLIVAAFGWASYEAIGLKDTLDETADEVKAVEEKYQHEEGMSEEESSEQFKARNKELTKTRIKGVIKVSKRFVGPSLVLIVGMGLTTKGFRVLRARNVMLGTALKGYEEAYKFYRNNVREDLGAEADLKYARGIVGEKEIEETVIDENGKEKKVKTRLPIVKEHGSPWRFEYSDTYFDSYQDSAESNLFFLKCEQEWWNHEYVERKGKITGVTMYDILKHLGFKFEVYKEGMTKKQFDDFMKFIRSNGWRDGMGGDGFIDLGIYRAINEPAIRRQSDVVWIEMNCDGQIYDI